MANFSDRFLAKVSGTDPYRGNSPQQVCETLRKLGVPLQEKWSFGPDIDSVEKFYAIIPPKLFDYAQEDFLDKYEFLHEYISTDIESIKKNLKAGPIGLAVTAWFEDERGVNYSPPDYKNNHWCVAYGYDDEKRALKVFDSYDGFLKLYSYDSLISVAKRYYIKKKEVPKKECWLKIWFKKWYN